VLDVCMFVVNSAIFLHYRISLPASEICMSSFSVLHSMVLNFGILGIN
jgi:hypothetical protein